MLHRIKDEALKELRPLNIVQLPSCVQIFNESAVHIRCPKCWSYSLSPTNEYSGLISFKIGWFDLAVQEILKSLLLQHSSKASILGTLPSLWSSCLLSGHFRS